MTPKDSELKPCPFCGAPALLVVPKVSRPWMKTGWFVRCSDRAGCQIIPRGPAVEKPETAIAAWNGRP